MRERRGGPALLLICAAILGAGCDEARIPQATPDAAAGSQADARQADVSPADAPGSSADAVRANDAVTSGTDARVDRVFWLPDAPMLVSKESADAAVNTNAVVCPSGFHACGDSCVADDNVAHCGKKCSPCRTPNNGVATCEKGECGIRCNDRYHRCGDTCLSNYVKESCGDRCTPCDPPMRGYPVCIDGMRCGSTCDSDVLDRVPGLDRQTCVDKSVGGKLGAIGAP